MAESKVVQCPYCPLMMYPKYLKSHSKNVHPEDEEVRKKLFDCYFCSSFFKDKRALGKHCSRYHGNEWREMANTKKNQKPISNFVCNECSMVFHRENNLLKHQQRIHPCAPQLQNGLHPCNLCKSYFKSKMWLGRHIAQCHVQPGAVDNNVENEDVFKNVFKNLKALDMQMKTDILSQAIDDTDIALVPEIDLNNLKVTLVDGKRLYHCDFCSEKYSKLSLLTRHMSIHGTKKPYQCSICHVKFRYCSALRHHAKKQHCFKTSDNRNDSFIAQLQEYAKKIKTNPIIYGLKKQKLNRENQNPKRKTELSVETESLNENVKYRSMPSLDTPIENANADVDQPVNNIDILNSRLITPGNNLNENEQNISLSISDSLIASEPEKDLRVLFQTSQIFSNEILKCDQNVAGSCAVNTNDQIIYKDSMFEPIREIDNNDLSLDMSISDLSFNCSCDNVSLNDIDVRQLDSDTTTTRQSTSPKAYQNMTQANQFVCEVSNSKTNEQTNNSFQIHDSILENDVDCNELHTVQCTINHIDDHTTNDIIISQEPSHAPSIEECHTEPLSTINNTFVNLSVLENSNLINLPNVHILNNELIMGKVVNIQNMDSNETLQENALGINSIQDLENNNGTDNINVVNNDAHYLWSLQESVNPTAADNKIKSIGNQTTSEMSKEITEQVVIIQHIENRVDNLCINNNDNIQNIDEMLSKVTNRVVITHDTEIFNDNDNMSICGNINQNIDKMPSKVTNEVVTAQNIQNINSQNLLIDDVRQNMDEILRKVTNIDTINYIQPFSTHEIGGQETVESNNLNPEQDKEDSFQDILAILDSNDIISSIIDNQNIPKKKELQPKSDKIIIDELYNPHIQSLNLENCSTYVPSPVDKFGFFSSQKITADCIDINDETLTTCTKINVENINESPSIPTELPTEEINKQNISQNCTGIETSVNFDLVQTSQELLQSLISDEAMISVSPSAMSKTPDDTDTLNNTEDEVKILLKLLSKRNLKYMLSQEVKAFECDSCPAKFKVKWDLIIHKNTHKKNVLKVCDICSKVFSSKKSLAFHIKWHQKDHKVRCKVCGVLRHPLSMKTHMRQHNDETPYPCPLCKKPFRNQSSKNHHIKTEHLHRDFQVSNASLVDLLSDIDVETVTNVPKSLPSNLKVLNLEKENTENIHTKLKVPDNVLNKAAKKTRDSTKNKYLLSCECGVLFNNMATLKTHKRRFDNQPHSCAFICDVCEEAFTSKAYLTRHFKATKHNS